MQRFFLAVALIAATWLAAVPSPAQAAPCLLVTLTGTMSGPVLLNGVAGAGTLVRYGDDSSDCSTVKLQFDAGRGTALRLSQVDLDVGQLDAIFFTHMHSDHTDGFADLMQVRWNWNSTGPKLDVVCSADAPSPLGFTMSCRNLVAHIGDAFIQSGEIAQRISEDKRRLAGGPAELGHLITFDPRDEAQVVWSKGDVRVSAIRSTHIAG
jgi:ribonuclease Z